MSDVDAAIVCTNCEHMASAHTDADSGDNSGSCTMANCTCPAMVTGKGTDAAGMTEIITLADAVSGGSASAPSGTATAGPLAQTLDGILDKATATIADLTFADLQPIEQSACALLNAASATVDLLLVALGVPDSDSDDMAADGGADGLDPGQDSISLAEATDAAIIAARDLFATVDTPTDGVSPLIELTSQADDASGSVLAALKAPDPDVEEGVDPDNDESAAGMSTSKTAAFVDDPAATDDTPAAADDLTFTMPVMVLEGVDTGDGRIITPEALTWRELPLSVMAMTETSEWGHEGAQLVGRLDTIERIDASAMINAKTGEAFGDGVQALKATGTFASIEVAETVAELVRGGFLKGVSVDVGDVESELEILNDEGDAIEISDDDLMDIMFMDGNMRENVTAGRVMGVTICPFPAFEGAYIVMNDGTSTPVVQASAKPSESHALNVLDEFGARTCVPCEEGMPILASAGPMTPPKSWFEDPELPGPTPLTITNDGRVYGHLAAWSSCHTGITGRCTTAPKSRNDYANFHVGALKTLDGDVISVGHITMGTGHASITYGAGPAMEHYDHTGAVAADVCVGEDKFGIWVSGATRPDLTELQLRQLRSSALSGDWRQIGRGLELVAALAVNVPGFPLPRARVASAATVALVAAGGRTLLQTALGTRATELEDLRRWQRNMQPVLDKILNDRADIARKTVLASRAKLARARVHTIA